MKRKLCKAINIAISICFLLCSDIFAINHSYLAPFSDTAKMRKMALSTTNSERERLINKAVLLISVKLSSKFLLSKKDIPNLPMGEEAGEWPKKTDQRLRSILRAMIKVIKANPETVYGVLHLLGEYEVKYEFELRDLYSILHEYSQDRHLGEELLKGTGKVVESLRESRVRMGFALNDVHVSRAGNIGLDYTLGGREVLYREINSTSYFMTRRMQVGDNTFVARIVENFWITAVAEDYSMPEFLIRDVNEVQAYTIALTGFMPQTNKKFLGFINVNVSDLGMEGQQNQISTMIKAVFEDAQKRGVVLTNIYAGKWDKIVSHDVVDLTQEQIIGFILEKIKQGEINTSALRQGCAIDQIDLLVSRNGMHSVNMRPIETCIANEKENRPAEGFMWAGNLTPEPEGRTVRVWFALYPGSKEILDDMVVEELALKSYVRYGVNDVWFGTEEKPDIALGGIRCVGRDADGNYVIEGEFIAPTNSGRMEFTIKCVSKIYPEFWLQQQGRGNAVIEIKPEISGEDGTLEEVDRAV